MYLGDQHGIQLHQKFPEYSKPYQYLWPNLNLPTLSHFLQHLQYYFANQLADLHLCVLQ